MNKIYSLQKRISASQANIITYQRMADDVSLRYQKASNTNDATYWYDKKISLEKDIIGQMNIVLRLKNKLYQEKLKFSWLAI